MPDTNSQNAEIRSTVRPRRSDTSWVIVVLAIVIGVLMGFVFRPVFDRLASEDVNPAAKTGLTDMAQTQVDQSIATALTPVSQSLDEIREAVKTKVDDPSNDAERISSELNALRLMLNDQASYVEQLIEAGNTEARTNLDEFVTQTNQQLGQLDALENSVNQLAAEFPRLRDRVQTLRPSYEDRVFDAPDPSDPPAETSVLDPATTTAQPLGSLIINSTSARDAAVTINGQNQMLRPGNNTFVVPVQQIELRHPESNTVWNLEASLWELQGDQYVINRKWVY